MKLTTYAGFGLVCAVLIMQRFDYAGFGVAIIGVSLCIPEMVKRLRMKGTILKKIYKGKSK